MPFESLSERFELILPGFPPEWLPLTYLYDPDLPLFPLTYIHALDPARDATGRPGHRDRIYGFVRHIALLPEGLRVALVLNKDLKDPQNNRFIPVVDELVRHRLGLGAPVRIGDLKDCLTGQLASGNKLIEELWHQIVSPAYGGALPFGKRWDAVFGLPRFVASWFSEGGRKGEFIQTHYFLSAFGERIACGAGVNIDFYLLPTYDELCEPTNTLALFPKFRDLTNAAIGFAAKYCAIRTIGPFKFSAFQLAKAKSGASRLDTAVALEIIKREHGGARDALYENYAAFNRGPPRSIIFLMMLNDLRRRQWQPDVLTPAICADLYDNLGGTWQSPKVLELYAQQCFGSEAALPLDSWLRTFVRWPLGFASSNKAFHKELFSCCSKWGKLERLIWEATQARKVHSSVASEILWCIRYGGPKKEIRGANPLSCKICDTRIRDVCPAYDGIKNSAVVFNTPAAGGFSIETSAKNLTTNSQTFATVRSKSVYDEYSPRDRSGKFRPFPQAGQSASPITVEQFIQIY